MPRTDSMTPQAQPLPTTFPTYQRAILPYTSRGNYLDEIADWHDGAKFVLSSRRMAGGLAWLAHSLMRPDNSTRPKPLLGRF